METLKKLFKSVFVIAVASCYLFTSCSDFPHHIVCEGKGLMIVYKIEECNNEKWGKYEYAITDASGKGWGFFSFQKFNIGDTIRISKEN